MSAGFLTPVRLEPVGFDQWRVFNDVRYESEVLGDVLVIPSGFVCDLDSIPRWVPVLYALLKGRAVKESVPHDYLYRRSGIARGVADSVMLEAMVAERKERWVRNSIYAGVRSFGWVAYKRKNPDAQSKGEDDEMARDRDLGPGA